MYKFDHYEHFSTKLNPIDDFLALLGSLKSREIASKIYVGYNPNANAAEINAVVKMVSAHIDLGINLFRSALKDDITISFNNIYYAMLNTCKAGLALRKGTGVVTSNKWHGATYNINIGGTGGLMDEEVKLKSGGIITRVYEDIMGRTPTFVDINLKLSDVYPWISCISYEYMQFYGKAFIPVEITTLATGNTNEWKLEISQEENIALDLSKMKIIRDTNSFVVDGTKYVSLDVEVNVSQEDAKKLLCKKLIEKQLIDETSDIFGSTLIRSPYNTLLHKLPKEVAILLAFYHLSNVVRYNPVYLIENIMQSKDYAVVIGLQRHGVLSFLEGYFSHIMGRGILAHMG